MSVAVIHEATWFLQSFFCVILISHDDYTATALPRLLTVDRVQWPKSATNTHSWRLEGCDEVNDHEAIVGVQVKTPVCRRTHIGELDVLHGVISAMCSPFFELGNVYPTAHCCSTHLMASVKCMQRSDLTHGSAFLQ